MIGFAGLRLKLWMARSIESSDDLSLGDLRQVVATLVAQAGALQEEVAELRLTVAARDAKITEQADEIALV